MCKRIQHYDSRYFALSALGKDNDPTTVAAESPDLFIFWGGETLPRRIDNKRLVKKIGEVDSDTADKIRENLKIILDLD